ncbi:BCL2 modifying factor 1 [Trichomycterus rosablanca]|uniref:BCL2 modifying factor 1 n=1 Tax=Trichomycterus rosablanca TaxID=2290929 RepID=UPI002F34EF91
MGEDEDDVFETVTHNWPSSISQIKQDRGTQTPVQPAAQLNGMLPCGVAREPTHLFYGSAGLLLLTSPARPDLGEDVMFQENPPHRLPAHSVEARIGRKLQMIGDQFYQEHMLQQRNQRNQRPFWLRLAAAVYALLFEGQPPGRRVDQR